MKSNTDRPKIPSPQDLFREAEEEFSTPNLSDYTAVMVELRDKGRTYRQIANWMTERGIKCSHNEVYYLVRRRAEAEEEREHYGVDDAGITAEVRRRLAREKEKEDETAEGEE